MEELAQQDDEPHPGERRDGRVFRASRLRAGAGEHDGELDKLRLAEIVLAAMSFTDPRSGPAPALSGDAQRCLPSWPLLRLA